MDMKIVILIVAIVLFILILIPYIYFYFKYRKDGLKKLKKDSNYRRLSIFKRLFLEFPRCFIYDFISLNPNSFPDFGVHIISGKQGCGKTLTLTYLLEQYKKKYPKIKIKTNYMYEFEDSSISHWKDLIDSNNGIYGEIDAIDELQNWFSSQQSKDFPPEMLQEITQQRKQRKIVLGTSQVFNRLSKQLREQTYLLYEPHTLFNCLTVVFKYEPIIKASDSFSTEKKFRGAFFFVHSQKLRNSYDTYRKIEIISKDGFVKNPLNQEETNINIKIEDAGKKKK